MRLKDKIVATVVGAGQSPGGDIRTTLSQQSVSLITASDMSCPWPAPHRTNFARHHESHM